MLKKLRVGYHRGRLTLSDAMNVMYTGWEPDSKYDKQILQ